MKQILLALFILFSQSVFSQNSSEYIRPILVFEIPIQRGMFDGLNTSVGALFGSEKFVQIGVLVGYRTHTKVNSNFEVQQLPNLSILWKIPVDKFSIMPMFTYGNKTYQDVSLRVGYALDKDKNNFIHAFGSMQMGYGIGTTILLSTSNRKK